MIYTPEQAIEFTKRSVAPLVSWPPPVNASKKKLLLLDIYLSICFINCVISFATLVYAIYVNKDDLETVIHATCSTVAIVQMWVKMTTCRWQRTGLQVQFFNGQIIPLSSFLLCTRY